MPSLPEPMLACLQPFASLFSQSRTWTKAVVLITGALLCQRGRTVCAALRVMGLKGEKAFAKYHRVLSHASWSALEGSKILLNQLVEDGEPLVIGIDEHLERRGGPKIKAKGCYRDAVRSSRSCIVKAFGLKWISLMVLKEFSWSKRLFALPFLTMLAPSDKGAVKLGKRHKTCLDWTVQALRQIRRWLPSKEILLTGDGAYATAYLCWASFKYHFALVTRLRKDARLFALPPESQGKGRPRKKGGPLKSPQEIFKDEDLPWKETYVRWYGKVLKKVSYLRVHCMWGARDPIPIQLVLLKDPEGKYESIPLLSTGLTLSPEAIIEAYIARWNVEVTFREVREHLGVETQRQWSDNAIASTTPVLFGLYSFVVLLASRLIGAGKVDKQEAAWYSKSDLTFSDLLTAVRKDIWRTRTFSKVGANTDLTKNLAPELLDALAEQLAQAA